MIQLQNDLESLIKNIFPIKITNFGHQGSKNYTSYQEIRILLKVEGVNAPILLLFRYLFIDNYYPIPTKEGKFNHNIKSDGNVSDEDWTTINMLNKSIIDNEDAFIKLFKKHQHQSISKDFLDYMMVVGEKAINKYKDQSPFDIDFEN